jgi:hypothetical protein
MREVQHHIRRLSGLTIAPTTVAISVASLKAPGPTGPGPPDKPPHSPQMKFVSHVATSIGVTRAHTLPDDGCSGQVVSRKFAQLHKLDTAKAKQLVNLRLANGKVVGTMDTIARVKMWIGDHVSEDWMWVTDLVGYDVIVGQPWLETHDVNKNYNNRTIVFASDYCTANCLTHGKPVKVTCHKNGKATIDSVETKTVKFEDEDICLVSAEAALAYARRDEKSVVWIYPEMWDKFDKNGTDEDDEHTAFMNLFAADCAAVSMEDFQKFHEKLNLPKISREELRKLVPQQYHHILELWDPKDAEELPPSRPSVDHEIYLTEGSQPTHQKAFGLSRNEMSAVKSYLQDEVRKGWVQPSKSPYAAPLLVVKQPGGGIRICID